MGCRIKLAIESDALALSTLGEKTFRETFARDNNPLDMELFVRKTFGANLQEKEIADNRRQIFLATENDKAIGYLHLFNGPVESSVGGPRPIEILRFYVDSPWHGTGVAHQLMEAAIQNSVDQGFKTLWLGVWEKNFKAQAFYRKWSFRETGFHTFYLGTDPQIDLIMERMI